MKTLQNSTCILAVIDAMILIAASILCYIPFINTYGQLISVVILPLAVIMFILTLKGFYKEKKYTFKVIYTLFEAIFLGTFISFIALSPITKVFGIDLVLINLFLVFLAISMTRCIYLLCKKIIRPVKNILIVGAGQDGKLIAEEIQARPELRMKVIGFLDDNMNGIEEEDSSIPILGLTYDSEAVIKDNNIDEVIIAVKSRMDSNILTDLAKGIPLGVKVWRMPTFYSHITQKLFTSKMAVNWLFYDYVRTKYIIYSYIKRVFDVIFACLILVLTLPVTLIAVIGIKLSDFGPIFFTQTRIGKFEKPFKMLKFRTMFQDTVNDGFDDDLEDVENNDKRIIPFCRWIRKFHIDDIPQVFNILKGEMSLVGPRPVREDVYFKNQSKIQFWECRSWVRPGITGWQQIMKAECIPEERLGFDLYYVKHRTLIWEIIIFVKYLLKIFSGSYK